ncbi:hypothetical protein, partial [Staphylococcus aureus]
TEDEMGTPQAGRSRAGTIGRATDLQGDQVRTRRGGLKGAGKTDSGIRKASREKTTREAIAKR